MHPWHTREALLLAGLCSRAAEDVMLISRFQFKRWWENAEETPDIPFPTFLCQTHLQLILKGQALSERSLLLLKYFLLQLSVSVCVYGRERRHEFSPSTMWVPEMGMELRSPGLVVSTLTCWQSHLDGQGRLLPYRPLTASSEILRTQSACFNITKQPKLTPFYHFYFLVLKQQCLAALSCVSLWHYNCQRNPA